MKWNSNGKKKRSGEQHISENTPPRYHRMHDTEDTAVGKRKPMIGLAHRVLKNTQLKLNNYQC